MEGQNMNLPRIKMKSKIVQKGNEQLKKTLGWVGRSSNGDYQKTTSRPYMSDDLNPSPGLGMASEKNIFRLFRST